MWTMQVIKNDNHLLPEFKPGSYLRIVKIPVEDSYGPIGRGTRLEPVNADYYATYFRTQAAAINAFNENIIVGLQVKYIEYVLKQ